MSLWEESSSVRVTPSAQPRKLAKVPFVELSDGRIQGIVSSGSDLRRVYVSSVAARTLAFTCRTNNNRPCGGAGGSTCSHIRALVAEGIVQYGAERVARYLRVDIPDEQDAAAALMTGGPADNQVAVAASVFARFLHELSALERPTITTPIPEMQWFATTRARA